MGTRSLTVMMDEQNREIAVLYRQMDGYPSGHGVDLADFLAPIRVTNGLQAGERSKVLANGMGCLAAQLVAHFKKQAGDFYLYPAGTRDAGEEWVYTVYASKEGMVMLRVQAGDVTYFGMPGTKQARMPVLFDDLPGAFDAQAIEQQREGLTIPNDFLEEQAKKSAP